jgi:hypothetical protein
VPRPLLGSVSYTSPSGLGRCRVGSCSWPVSDGRPEGSGVFSTGTCWFRDFLVISGLCVLSAGPGQWWLSPPRSSFFFYDEPCRHKILDLIGDFSLLAKNGNQGFPIAHIVAYRVCSSNSTKHHRVLCLISVTCLISFISCKSRPVTSTRKYGLVPDPAVLYSNLYTDVLPHMD